LANSAEVIREYTIGSRRSASYSGAPFAFGPDSSGGLFCGELVAYCSGIG
jgi:hypothetical protein